MTWARECLRKPESASAHFAWGFMVAALSWRFGASDVLVLVIPVAAGVAWEVVAELVVRLLWQWGRVVRKWHASIWDVPLWFVGGGAFLLTWYLTKRGV